MGYPYVLKRLDAIKEYFFPWPSEADFIKVMGRYWLWRRGFHHQVMIGPYRADFLSEKLKQVIEIDGQSKIPQDIVKQQEYHEKQQMRDRFLLKRGYSVLHVPYYAIRYHPHTSRREIAKWVANPAYKPTL